MENGKWLGKLVKESLLGSSGWKSWTFVFLPEISISIVSQLNPQNMEFGLCSLIGLLDTDEIQNWYLIITAIPIKRTAVFNIPSSSVGW